MGASLEGPFAWSLEAFSLQRVAVGLLSPAWDSGQEVGVACPAAVGQEGGFFWVLHRLKNQPGLPMRFSAQAYICGGMGSPAEAAGAQASQTPAQLANQPLSHRPLYPSARDQK